MSESGPRAQWRRLDPRMLLVHPINELLQFLPAVLAAFVFGSAAPGSRWLQAAAIVVPILLGLARYLTTEYRVSPTMVEVKRGLVSRKVLTAPVDRVRTVELTSPMIHRLLGLSKVHIGTGSGGSGPDRIELDSLPQAEGRALRESLLHRAHGTTTETVRDDTLLLRLDPGWARYAPLTTGGIGLAAVGFGALVQFGGEIIDATNLSPHVPDVAGPILIALALVSLIGFVLLCGVLAVIGYLVGYWDFRLSRDAGARSFHVTRGLFTTRETSFDMTRVHGVTVSAPLGLRLVGAAHLDVVASGTEDLDDVSSVAVPPAPRRVVDGVAGLMLRDDLVLNTPLLPHGSRAVRRRWTRGFVSAVLLSAAWSFGVVALNLPIEFHGAAVAFVGANAWLARDRGRRLGHALAARHVLFRKGSLRGTTTALERGGIIGWNLEQSWFQRRAGLVTLTATTSAGEQYYGVYDVPLGEAIRFADEATPGLLGEFLAGPGGA